VKVSCSSRREFLQLSLDRSTNISFIGADRYFSRITMALHVGWYFGNQGLVSCCACAMRGVDKDAYMMSDRLF